MKKITFAGRLTKGVMIILGTLMAVLIFTIYMLTQNYMSVGESNRYISALRSTNEYVRRALSDVYVATTNNQQTFEMLLDRPDEILPAVERIVRDNPRIRSFGISFVADYYPEKGRWFAPYVVKDADGNLIPEYIGSETRDYPQEEWFVEALQKGKGYWSDPFFDQEDATAPLIAYVLPVRDAQGRIAAILGADMSLDWLTEKIQELDKENRPTRLFGRIFGSKYAVHSFIIDGNGTYIAHHDHSRILTDNLLTQAEATESTKDDTIVQAMINGEEGYNNAVIEGVPSYVFYSPMNHTDWSLGIKVPMFTFHMPGNVLTAILLLIIAAGLAFTAYALRKNVKRATKPLALLTRSADEVAKGNFNAPLPEIYIHDEIYQLRQSFAHMQHSLSSYIDELKETTASKAAIENELNIAHNIQMSMLPKIFPPYPERSDIDIFGTLTPAKAVGGDLFDFYIREEKLLFCIGDVSGKGIPAALVMAVIRAMFRTVSAHEFEPHLIVTALNNAMAEDNESNMFATLFVGTLDLHTGTLRFCNAGHDNPLLIGRGIGLLECDANIPVGLMNDWNYTCQEVGIDKGTTIFLYTDGLNEAEKENHQQFGENRMLAVAKDLLAKQQHQPENLIKQMVESVRGFIGNAEQSDDLTMLAVQYHP